MKYAFTAIELLIAIVLSAMLLTLAFMGFRSASQAMMASNRQSIQNAILRSGFDKALDELDYWKDYDLPEDTSGIADNYLDSNHYLRLRALRVVTPQPQSDYGLPFTAARHWDGVRADGHPVFASGSATWEAISHPWRANDERTWTRENYFQSSPNTAGNIWPHGEGGRYNIVSSTTPGAIYHPGGQPDFGRWLPDAAFGLRQALGIYGTVDYLPVNAPSAFHNPLSGELDFLGPQYGTIVFPGQMGLRRAFQSFAIGLWPYNPWLEERQQGSSEIHARQWGSALSTFRTRALNLSLATSSNNTGFQLRGMTVLEPLQPITPPGWPTGESGITRYHAGGRFINLVRLRWSEISSSDQVEITFSCLGSTLRGARQQRRAPTSGAPTPYSNQAGLANLLPPDGWISWHGNIGEPGPGPAPIIEATLDTP